MKKELNLPNYAVFDQIDFWIVAPDDSFKSEGIEQGDLVACYQDQEWFTEVDEPRDIYLLNYRCRTRFIKRDCREDDVTIYFDDKNEEKITMSWEDYQKYCNELGKVTLILKCKYSLTDEKTFLKNKK